MATQNSSFYVNWYYFSDFFNFAENLSLKWI